MVPPRCDERDLRVFPWPVTARGGEVKRGEAGGPERHLGKPCRERCWEGAKRARRRGGDGEGSSLYLTVRHLYLAATQELLLLLLPDLSDPRRAATCDGHSRIRSKNFTKVIKR